MPYKIIHDQAVSVNYVISKDEDGKLYESAKVWMPGEIVPDEFIAPRIKKQFDDGDLHARSLFSEQTGGKSSSKAEQAPKGYDHQLAGTLRQLIAGRGLSAPANASKHKLVGILEDDDQAAPEKTPSDNPFTNAD